MSADINPLSLLEVSLIEDGGMNVLPNVDYIKSEELEHVDSKSGIIPSDDVLQNGTHSPNLPSEKFVEHSIKTLSEVSSYEWSFRQRTFSNLSAVSRRRLHCTVCNEHVGCSLDLNTELIIHPLLKVLICPRCRFTYDHITFPLNTSGMDIRCRWCGRSVNQTPTHSDRPNSLKNCTLCPFAFCEQCIRSNITKGVKHNWNRWVCFVCQINQIWPHRALAWALTTYLDSLTSSGADPQDWPTDLSTCCRTKRSSTIITNVPVVTNRLRKLAPKPKSQTDDTQLKPEVGVYSLVQTALPPAPSTSQPVIFNKVQPFSANPCWFRTTVSYILENMNVIGQNIKAIHDTVLTDESDECLKSKIDTVCKLLSVCSKQLENNEKGLRTDWEVRKSVDLSSLLTASVQNTGETLMQAQTSTSTIAPTRKKRTVSPKRQYFTGSKRTKVRKILPDTSSESILELHKKFNLKECSIKLTKNDSLSSGELVIFS